MCAEKVEQSGCLNQQIREGYVEENYEDFVIINHETDSASKSYYVSTQADPELCSFVSNSDQVASVKHDVIVHTWQISKSPSEIEKLTPGFENEGCNCFANAALKQLILSSEGYEVYSDKVPKCARKLAYSYKNLNKLFYQYRNNKCSQCEVDAARKAFFVEIRKLQESNCSGLDENQRVALTYLNEQFRHFGTKQWDSQIFSDAVCQLCGMIDEDNGLFLHHTYRLKKSWEGKMTYESDARDNGSFFSVDVADRSLAEILSSEFESTDESWAEAKGMNGKVEKLDATSVVSVARCNNGERLQSLKIQAKIFSEEGSRKSVTPNVFFTENDDDLTILILDFESRFNFFNFRIRTVVCHLGGRSVNSGHYLTLENLGEKNWLVHSDNSIKLFKGNLQSYFESNPNTLPYLFDLQRTSAS